MADNSNIIKTITVNNVTCDVAEKYDVDGNAIKDTYVQKDGSNVTIDNLQINNSISVKNPVSESYTEFASHDGSKLTIGTTEASGVDIIGGTASGIRLKSDTVYLGDKTTVFEAHPDKLVKVGSDSYVLQLKSSKQPTWGSETIAMKSDLSNYLSLSGGTMNGSLTVNNDTVFGKADGTSEHNFRGEIYTSHTINLNDGDLTLNGNDDDTRLTVNGNEVAHLNDFSYDPNTKTLTISFL